MRSELVQPKLCLTVTMTFRDDPRLMELLERTSAKRASIGAVADVPVDDDEYMIESFDGPFKCTSNEVRERVS